MPHCEGTVSLSPHQEQAVVTSSPVARPEPVGIVIRSGPPAPKPVRFWAYFWAAAEDSVERHWHERVPAERVA